MTSPAPETRRSFLKKSAAVSAFLASANFPGIAASPTANDSAASERSLPWYRKSLRWGQTNITEMDPQRYDIAWWKQHWKKTHTQGVIVNAGGIVAYYPSQFPLHHRAAGLGDRDLFGELARAAHDEGLAVLARMDSNRVHEEFYRAHQDWIARDINGDPYRNTELYVTCVNSPYYDEYIPSVLREIIGRSHPEGFADNNWNGLERDQICYCDNCARRFREKSGESIPREKNWDDSIYRRWIEWNYARRLEIWDLFNRVTKDAGGPHCLWIGMNGGDLAYQCRRFRDFKAICERSEIVLLDDQARYDNTGFQHNGEIGKRVHGLLGWDKFIPESMAMYQLGRPTFRLSSKPEPEARLWMLEGFAGGIQPWWHHVGAYQEDRRAFKTAEPILRWHAENQEYLVNRRPVAAVGLVWSQENIDFYGRDDAENLTELPWRGWTNALVRARIPYLPIHADHIDRDAGELAALVLPNVGALSRAQAESVQRFVERGGGLVATGETSRCNEWGDPAPDFALADLFGAHVVAGKPASIDVSKRRRAAETLHTYLRLTPSVAARAYGPNAPDQPAPGIKRHPVLAGFDDTDILPFGGELESLRVTGDAMVLATFIPPFPTFPPESVWMRQPQTDVPALIVRETASGGRVAFLPADLDRRFGRDNLPDHGDLLANLARWAAHDRLPLQVHGVGLVDCHLYRQRDRFVLHLVNLTNPGTWRGLIDELIPIGPLSVRLRLPAGFRSHQVKFLVSGRTVRGKIAAGWIQFELPSILDHEVAVV